ncbi:MAG: ABC transporter permease [Oscillospiraceae bacterium]|nr:ABC transporter permease [Oscillospiraceae bacterium]
MFLSSEARFNRKLDKIRAREEAGKIGFRFKNRSVAKFMGNRLAVAGLVIFLILFLCCIAAPLLTSFDPEYCDLRAVLKPPSAEHILGTDKVGRDLFSRILYGGRMSMLVAFSGALGGALVGALLGTYAGYKGGWFDKICMRISEVFTAFPQLVLVLMLLCIVGQSTGNLIFVFVVTGWTGVFRQARAQMLSLREEEYAQALRAFGISDFQICFRHLLPNAVGPLVVNITLNIAMYILEEAALSYLGLGIPSNIPTWGNILNASQDLYALQNAWWLWLPVGIVISLLVMSINFIGDGLRDSVDASQQG